MATAETSDEQIVERALAGDVDAFGEIVRRWERR
nr:RNA polymerase sigma factor SigM [Pyrinomonadaceae bacterium]